MADAAQQVREGDFSSLTGAGPIKDWLGG
jgi:hypothetical protein